MVTPRYLPPLLSRSCTVAASKVGSNCLATCVTAVTNPSTLAPITLMGNCDGYSIRDSLRASTGAMVVVSGVSGLFMDSIPARWQSSQMGTVCTFPRQPARQPLGRHVFLLIINGFVEIRACNPDR